MHFLAEGYRQHLAHMTRYLCTSWRDFDATWYKYSSRQWTLLRKFSISEVKGQGRGENKRTFVRRNTFRRRGVEAQSFRITDTVARSPSECAADDIIDC